MNDNVALPPAVDMSALYDSMENYPQLHEDFTQKPMEEIAVHRQCIVWSTDKKPNDPKRSYLASGTRTFWNMYSKLLRRAEDHRQQRAAATITYAPQDVDPASHYELIMANRPVHLYIDIEYYWAFNKERERALGDENTKHDSVAYVNHLFDMLLTLVERMLAEYYNLPNMRQRWEEIWMDSSNEEKCSRHIMLRLPDNMMFSDVRHCGSFMRRLMLLAIREYGEPCNNPFFIHITAPSADLDVGDRTVMNNVLRPLFDTGVYTVNRNWRLVGSSKKGKRRELWRMRNDGEAVCVGAVRSTANWHVCPWQDITYEYFARSLAQAAPDDPTQVRLLHFREPTGEAPKSICVIPTHIDRRYVLRDTVCIGVAGSIPEDFFRQLRREFQTLGKRSAEQMESIDTRFAEIKERGRAGNSFASDGTVSYEDQLVKLTREVLSRNAVPSGVCVAQFAFAKEFGGALQNVLGEKAALPIYTWVKPQQPEWMKFQTGRICPLINKDHESNNVQYLVNFGHSSGIPYMKLKCFKCGDTEWRSAVPVPFWDDHWKEKYTRYLQQTTVAYSVSVVDFFGFLF